MSLVVASACAEDAEGVSPPRAVESTLQPQDLTRDVTPGEQSEYVNVVQQYLQRYGYLPNSTLTAHYPSWRPIVNAEPDWGTYDATTELAVRALQQSLGLNQTGVVDAATREHIQRPRCHHPEGEAQLDPRDKFDREGIKRPGRALTWSFDIGDEASISAADASAAVAKAFAQFADITGLTISLVNGGNADLVVRFAPLRDGVLGEASFPSSGNTLTFASNLEWSTPGTGRLGRDVETVAVHEIGHLLGLYHSSVADAVMFPETDGSYNTVLTVDDQLGLRTLYNAWVPVGGAANDVAITPNNEVWSVGANPPFATYKLDVARAVWVPAPETTPDGRQVQAKLLTVDLEGRPWVTDFDGQIFTFSSSDPTNGEWTQRNGECAQDIGSGGGRVWIISCTPGEGGYQVKRWNGPMLRFEAANFAAARIAVDHVGCPWVVSDKGDVYRTASCNTLESIEWERLSYDPEGTRFTGPVARDIAVAAANTSQEQAWIISTDGSIWLWNEQNALEMGGPPPRKRATWISVAADLAPPKSFHIAVSTNQAWVITSEGGIAYSGPGIRQP